MNFGEKYSKALNLIEKAYKENKELVTINNSIYPKEYLYAQRMIEQLELYHFHASEEVYLAAWCQHLYRWEIPRSNYPMDRSGYHQWRTYLYSYQANKTGELLKSVGYPEDSISEIESMICKENLKSNKQTQLLEDVVCLVFFKYYLSDFIEKHKDDREKLRRIIKNTWLKMSDEGHKEALEIQFDKEIKELILEAVN